MKTRAMIAALAALTAAPMAQAMLLDWRLTSEYGTDMGGFKLDFAQPKVVAPRVHGDLGTYDIPSFTFLDTTDYIAFEQVHDFILIFSSLTGTSYFTDYGGGASSSLRINDSAIRIGTIDGPLSPTGGSFNVIIEEVFSYDESYTWCSYYVEYYDDITGEYIQTDQCAFFDTTSYFNIDSGYWYYGVLSSLDPVPGGVAPVPPTAAILSLGLGALALGRRRRSSVSG